jgi:hypothetical protein
MSGRVLKRPTIQNKYQETQENIIESMQFKTI